MQLSVSGPKSGSSTSYGGVIVDAAIYERVIIVGAIVTMNYTINLGIPYLFIQNQCKNDDDNYDYDYDDDYDNDDYNYNHRWEQVLQLTTNDIYYETNAFWRKGSNVDIGKNFAIVGGSSGAYVFEYECNNSVNCSIGYSDMNFSYGYNHNYSYNYDNDNFDENEGCRVIQETKLITGVIRGVAISASNTQINAMVCACDGTNCSINIFEYNKSNHRWIQTAKIASISREYGVYGDVAIKLMVITHCLENIMIFGMLTRKIILVVQCYINVII